MVYDNSTLTIATLTQTTIPTMVDMNVKNVYKEEWYDSVSVNEIDSASVVKEMNDVRDG